MTAKEAKEATIRCRPEALRMKIEEADVCINSAILQGQYSTRIQTDSGYSGDIAEHYKKLGFSVSCIKWDITNVYITISWL
jgi:hypothetical protein